jgi:Polyketide cyclase / dehydrase and lipid transport
VTYRFLTAWLLDCERQAVWDALEDVDTWPDWWRGVRCVRVLDGERYRIAWRSRIPYDLEFDFSVERIDAPREMHGTAEGQLAGTGHWRLFEQHGVTAVTYEWNVRTTKTWMNVIGPLARPVFAYNHDVVMRWGGEGLARRLDCKLLAAG